MKVALVSERIRTPYDEGIKNVAVHLLWALSQCGHSTLGLTTAGSDDAEIRLRNIASNRLLLTGAIREAIHEFGPDIIAYIPTACGTLFSLVRGQVLRSYCRRARLGLLLLQPRAQAAWARLVMRCLRPDVVLTQSARTARPYRDLGWRTALLPPAVDTDRFRPVNGEERAELRARYGVPAGSRIVTHVGHLKSKRNLEQLLVLGETHGYHVLIVGSTSTEQDAVLSLSLRTRGATVLDQHVPRIEEIYRLSDAYVFLAQEETAAIDVPLSVLEAMACNLPVVCTPFGGLPDWLSDGKGFFFWRGSEPMGDLVARALHSPCATRRLVESWTWTTSARVLLEQIAGTQDGR